MLNRRSTGAALHIRRPPQVKTRLCHRLAASLLASFARPTCRKLIAVETDKWGQGGSGNRQISKPPSGNHLHRREIIQLFVFPTSDPSPRPLEHEAVQVAPLRFSCRSPGLAWCKRLRVCPRSTSRHGRHVVETRIFFPSDCVPLQGPRPAPAPGPSWVLHAGLLFDTTGGDTAPPWAACSSDAPVPHQRMDCSGGGRFGADFPSVICQRARAGDWLTIDMTSLPSPSIFSLGIPGRFLSICGMPFAELFACLPRGRLEAASDRDSGVALGRPWMVLR